MFEESIHTINFFYECGNFYPKGLLKRPALFLDRDGVILKDKHYLSNVKNVELEIGAKDLVRTAYDNHYPVVIVTNQSGISRGYFSWNDYNNITKEMIKLLDSPIPISAIYSNGLPPEASNKTWRKPGAGMIINAANSLDIDLAKSIMVGDRLSDLISASLAGITTFVHVKTGHGNKELSDINEFIKKNKNITLYSLDTLDDFPLAILYQ